jgi:hypothetical protein
MMMDVRAKRAGSLSHCVDAATALAMDQASRGLVHAPPAPTSW